MNGINDSPWVPDRPMIKSLPVTKSRVRMPSWLLEMAIFVAVLWYVWIADFAVFPVAFIMGWVPMIVVGLVILRRRFVYPLSPVYLASFALCAVPVLKNFLVRDWTGMAEAGMLLVGFLASPLVGLYIRSPKILVGVIFLFVLPLCFAGWITEDPDIPSLLGGFVLQRGGLHPPGGTHHFLGSIMGIMLCLAWRKMPWKYLILFALLMIASGARTYWFAAFIAIGVGEVMRLRWFRPHYIIFGALFWVTISVAVLKTPDLDEALSDASWTKYISLGGESEVDKYGVFTGRSDLWIYYLTLYHERRKTGWPTEYIRPQKIDRGGGEINQGADGEILRAGSESQFDYYLARDGVSGFFAVAFYAALAACFLKAGNINSVILITFVTAAAFGNPITRITYSPSFIIFAAALWSNIEPARRRRRPRVTDELEDEAVPSSTDQASTSAYAENLGYHPVPEPR